MAGYGIVGDTNHYSGVKDGWTGRPEIRADRPAAVAPRGTTTVEASARCRRRRGRGTEDVALPHHPAPSGTAPKDANRHQT